MINSETTKNYCGKKKKKLVSQLTDLIPGGKGKDVSKAWNDWTNPQSGTFRGDVGVWAIPEGGSTEEKINKHPVI